MFNLVKQLKKDRVPIDGIGIQGHLIVGELPTTIKENLEAFTSLGVEVAITELDIRMNLPVTDALLAQQKADYETVVSACKAVKGCIGVTIWDWTDKVWLLHNLRINMFLTRMPIKYSWVPGVFAGQGAACPWDEVSANYRLGEFAYFSLIYETTFRTSLKNLPTTESWMLGSTESAHFEACSLARLKPPYFLYNFVFAFGWVGFILMMNSVLAPSFRRKTWRLLTP